MEQYWMLKKQDPRNLRLCIKEYSPNFIFIREIFSIGGKIKVCESLVDKTLSFKKTKAGLSMQIDGKVVFHFPLKDYHKGFSLAYERIEPTDDGVGRMVMLGTGVDPYDPNLPEPRKSRLRTVLDNHGPVPKFHTPIL